MLSPEMVIQKIQQFDSQQWNSLIEFVEFLEFRSNQVDLPPKVLENCDLSFTEVTQEFIGCLDSDLEDLSHNPKYLEGFGQQKDFFNFAGIWENRDTTTESLRIEAWRTEKQ